MMFELLLTDLRNLGPALGPPVAASSAHDAPLPTLRLPPVGSAPGHSNDLAAEGWGVVVPDTPAGQERLRWIQPLIELRARQCGVGAEEIAILRVAPGLGGPGLLAWRADYEAIHPQRRPGYLLLLGDLDEIPLELQQELMVSACVGRLCFTTPDGQPDQTGYQAYCAKLCRIEAAHEGWSAHARLLLYAARDGTQSVETGYFDLIRRCYRDARNDRQLGADELRIFGSAADHQWYTQAEESAAREQTLLHWAEMRHPTVLLSMTHGAGVPDPAEQRLRQGALVLGEAAGQRRVDVLDHGFFARSFLPGGFWFLKACFGAGTPSASVYQPWIEALYRLGRHSVDPRIVLAYLAAPPARPFVARLPQVALAHSDGPLGVLGHVDLAWTYGYQRLDEVDGQSVHAEHGPYYDVVRAVVTGSRFGVAVASLSQKAQQLGTDLATLYGRSEAGGSMDEATATRRAWLWMRYLDLAGYILLGDPAAQVPTAAARAIAEQAQQAVATRPAPKQAQQAVATRPAPEQGKHAARMEELVLACLRQRQPPSEIARAAGVHPTTLERWVRIYQDAGRAALAASAPELDGGDDASGAGPAGGSS